MLFTSERPSVGPDLAEGSQTSDGEPGTIHRGTDDIRRHDAPGINSGTGRTISQETCYGRGVHERKDEELGMRVSVSMGPRSSEVSELHWLVIGEFHHVWDI